MLARIVAGAVMEFAEARTRPGNWLPVYVAELPRPYQRPAYRVEADRVVQIAEYLPIAQVSELKRAEVRAAKADALTRAIGSDTDIRLAMSRADELINHRYDRELTEEEAQQLGIFAAAQDVSELINAKQDALLAEIDAAELAGDLDALRAIAWEE